MSSSWSAVSRQFRLRHQLSQVGMAELLRMPRPTLARCERGDAAFTASQREKLLDLCLNPPEEIVRRLRPAVTACRAPRALSRTARLNLQVLSEPARAKRPSIMAWVGRDLVRIASGVLEEILEDAPLRKAILRREVAGIVSTTASVLATPEAPTIGHFRTTTTYFFADGVLYSDAVSVPVSADEPCGYTPIYIDEIGHDLFGGHDLLEAALQPARGG